MGKTPPDLGHRMAPHASRQGSDEHRGWPQHAEDGAGDDAAPPPRRGTAGVVVHHVLPGVPLGLAFTCLLAAVPGALVAAPFSMVLLAAFLTQGRRRT